MGKIRLMVKRNGVNFPGRSMGVTGGRFLTIGAEEAKRWTRKEPRRLATRAAAMGSPSREWVAVPSFFKRERAGGVEQVGEVGVDDHRRVVGQVERRVEADAGAVGISGEGVGVASGFGSAVAEETLHGHENEAALPAPVKAVEARIERVAGGESRDVGGVGDSIGADVEADGSIVFFG